MSVSVSDARTPFSWSMNTAGTLWLPICGIVCLRVLSLRTYPHVEVVSRILGLTTTVATPSTTVDERRYRQSMAAHRMEIRAVCYYKTKAWNVKPSGRHSSRSSGTNPGLWRPIRGTYIILSGYLGDVDFIQRRQERRPKISAVSSMKRRPHFDFQRRSAEFRVYTGCPLGLSAVAASVRALPNKQLSASDQILTDCLSEFRSCAAYTQRFSDSWCRTVVLAAFKYTASVKSSVNWALFSRSHIGYG